MSHRSTPPPPLPQSANSHSNAHNNANGSSSPSHRPGHSHSHSSAGLAPARVVADPAVARYRASVDAGGSNAGSNSASASARNWGSMSNATGAGARSGRPSSDLLMGSNPSFGSSIPSPSPENDAMERWLEDLQHYESTLEEMAAASTDTNFKEELSAIEQWFRVLSEPERTAALYSLLGNSTQVQMRFFVTVLQQMMRADPMTALLSPANPGQMSMEAQMDARLAQMNTKSPVSPAFRQFARQSLGAQGSSSNDNYLSPHSASAQQAPPQSPINTTAEDAAAAAVLQGQRARLKSNARISAPANILLGASASEALKSPLWAEKERVMERRSPSPNRPKSTGSNLDAQPNSSYAGQNLSQSTGPSSATYLRSPAPDADFAGQLSPAVGGSWASMVNTPLVPMFGKRTDGSMEPGNYGGPNLEGASNKLGTWASSAAGAEPAVVLEDVRKFRRSARVSGSAASGFGFQGVNGGALGGMYDDQQQALSPASQQQQQNRNVSPSSQLALTSMQQNALNLGLAGLQLQNQSQQQQQNRSGTASPGLLSAQHAAVAAQQNWRNGLGSPSANSPNGQDQFSQQLSAFGMNPQTLQNTGNLSANAQLANLFALQQQMMQQQQFQQLNMAAAAGIALTPVQLMGLQQQQQQARMGMGMGMGMLGQYGMGGMNMSMGSNMGLASPRRSPRSGNDRSPGGPSSSKTNLPSTTGSGSNPDEPLDMALLSDVPSWLRSLRLHKYTPNFEGSNWKEMCMLDEARLEGKGVSALGARRKLLKVFETVRGKKGMALPGDGIPSATSPNEASESIRSVSPGTSDH